MDYSHFSEPIRQRLDSMYRSEPQVNLKGQIHQIDSVTRINVPCGLDLYDCIMRVAPKNTLEVGLAYGFSTLYILEAQKTHNFTHTAIDPSQYYAYGGIGHANGRTFSNPGMFFWKPDFSFDALPTLKMLNKTYEVIFIDGGHRFDDVLTDFTLAAQMVPEGGYIVLDDASMPSISRVVNFLRENRTDFQFEQYRSHNLAFFRRIGQDNRQWDHFVDF